jgi:hypothetical protein
VTQQCALLCDFTALRSSLLCFAFPLLRHYPLFHFTLQQVVSPCNMHYDSCILLAHLPAEKLPVASTIAYCRAGVPGALASASTGAAVTLGSSYGRPAGDRRWLQAYKRTCTNCNLPSGKFRPAPLSTPRTNSRMSECLTAPVNMVQAAVNNVHRLSQYPVHSVRKQTHP